MSRSSDLLDDGAPHSEDCALASKSAAAFADSNVSAVPLAIRSSRPLPALARCRCLAPQIEKPIGGEVVSELEHLRVIAPELLTHAAGQTSAFLLQIVGHPRPLAQLHNHWLVVRQTPKGVPIGAQAVGQHVSVAPVVL